MFEFPDWVDAIAEISTQPVYQDLTVSLIDPLVAAAAITGYDIDTGTVTVDGDGVFWTGQARLVTPRWGVGRENVELANATTAKSILVQFPQTPGFGTEEDPIYRIKKGIVLRVDNAPKNPALSTYVFVCTSDIQGGAAAARTIEFEVSGDSVVSSAVVPEPEPEPEEEP